MAVLVLVALLPGLAGAQSGYVGDEACGTCHAETRHAYERTIHARVLNERNGASARAKRGCEACHGPGLAHVQSAGKGEPATDWVAFGSREPDAIRRENEVCLSCHAGSRVKLWPGSAHDANDVGCATCHDTKTPASSRHLLEAADQTTGCGGCHTAARAQQLRNRHMPTRPGPAGAGGEGWMDCSSCHNPHGTVAESLIEANSVNESCYACHAEKRGPFLWEHSPVNESCLNCHLPHGSIRPNMLRMAGPRLCQTCHIEVLHPSENRRSTDRFSVGQSCGHCHIKVHGSNHPSGNFLTR
jgi:DmsE family decaheme c-type cytochrome